jgi:beta-galactosidase
MYVRTPEGQAYRAYDVADVLVPEGKARVLLTYSDHYYAGRAAAIENPYGQGRCIYMGTVLGDDGVCGPLRAWVLQPLSLPAVEDLPQSVEVSQRVKGEQRYTFYLNHSPGPVQVDMAVPGVDLLTGRQVGRSVEIPGYDLLIVQE